MPGELSSCATGRWSKIPAISPAPFRHCTSNRHDVIHGLLRLLRPIGPGVGVSHLAATICFLFDGVWWHAHNSGHAATDAHLFVSPVGGPPEPFWRSPAL